MDPNSSTDDLIPETLYSASASYIEPRDAIEDANTENWSFTVKPANQCASEPYIYQLSPNGGMWNRCMTVIGRNFEDDPSGNIVIAQLDAELDINKPLTTEAEQYWSDTPPSLNVVSRTWSDKSIGADFIAEPEIDKLPTGFADGNPLAFNVVVTVDKGGSIGVLDSNPVSFSVDTSGTYLGPCLDKIIPNSGAWGRSMELQGRNLSKASEIDGSVLFTPNIIKTEGNIWEDRTTVLSSIPDLTQDGLVRVKIGNETSNGVVFDIAGGIGQSCSTIPN
ncbi:MAG: hypothetical protein COW93_01475, partial [Parcubacteria group bacterium CG22_combo_CG10-13_8_21_14_all_41_9]